MFHFRTSLGPVDLAFTDRIGGVSGAPWDSLNLALAGGDDREAVARNLELVLTDFAPGSDLADLVQVHGSTVVDAAPGSRPEADGIVTHSSDVVLMVRAADCVPVLLADPDHRVIGAAHAGRAGMVAGVVPATVARMRDRGAARVTAWIGPAICGRCYEVPAELREAVADQEPASAATTRWGTPAIDVVAGVRAQLERIEVTVVEAGVCTREHAELYSFRRDGDGAGRHAGLIRLRGAAA